MGLPESLRVVFAAAFAPQHLNEKYPQGPPKPAGMILSMVPALLAFVALQSASVEPDALLVQKQLRAADQALLDAIAPGDHAVWERFLAKDAVYVDENGAVLGRDQFLAAVKPLPAGSSGHISIVDYRASVHGNVALVVHKDDERENYHGIPLRADYLMTETWLKEGADWH